MSVIIVGTTALDSIKTPTAENPRLLGGSGSHAAVAASFFAPVRLIGVIGEDFPEKYVRLYRKHKIDLAGLQRAPGRTFHWAGEYEINMNNRRTLDTQLGVLEQFQPAVPRHHRDSPFVLLANISPAVQHAVLSQMSRPRFVIADTMDLWLNIALPDLLKLLRRVDALVLNDSEARQLAGCDNVIAAARRLHQLGPKFIIVKKGEHGSILSGPGGLFVAPAYPLHRVVDPTGAGDSFVGGLIGYLASARGPLEKNLRRALVYGSVVASFNCEGFGLNQITRVTRAAIEARVKELEALGAILIQVFLASFQFLETLTQPIGLLWVLLVLATVLLLWKRRWRMALLPGGAAAFLWLIGASGLPYLLLASLEQPYAGVVLSNVPPCDAVVMLGGTHRASRYDAFGLDLTPCADRVVMAVELTRLGKGKVLALGGSSYWDGAQQRPDAELLQRWLETWRVTPAPIVTLGVNRNTHDEAEHSRAMMKEKGWQRVVLVTSAYHMKRAEAVFVAAGVPVICVPCDFQAVLAPTPPTGNGGGFGLVPRLEGFQSLGLYLHEKVGWLVYRTRGWIAADWAERKERVTTPDRRP